MPEQPRIVLFLMEGVFSRTILEGMLEKGLDIAAIILPSHSAITGKQHSPLLETSIVDSVKYIANENAIPQHLISREHIGQIDALVEKISPDLVVVACFPYLIPVAIFNGMNITALNVHPSLLPAYRGPVPIFWQYYYGEAQLGLSIHKLSAEFDKGDILLQESVSVKDGMNGLEASKFVAEHAARAITQLVSNMSDDKLKTIPQEGKRSSYHSWPDIDAFKIKTDWSVRRAYNFICASTHWRQMYQIQDTQGELLTISEALSYEPEMQLDRFYIDKGEQLLIRFSDGCLLASK